MRCKIIIIIMTSLSINGCSIQKLAVRSMSGLLYNSMTTLYEEDDLQLAEQAIAADLKLLEGILKSDPDNSDFLLMAAQGFTAYALGFAEDTDPTRARKLYLRGRNYGIKILMKNKQFEDNYNQNIEQFKNALQSFSQKDVPALFWTANSWAGWINLSFTNTQALADLPKVQLLMERVIELDESFFYGGAHLFFGTIYAARPPILGGDMNKSKYHFDKCFEYATNSFLLPYVYYAKFYLVRDFNEELFEKTLNKVIDTPDDILKEQTLPNAIAKQKAKQLLSEKEDLF